MTFASVPIRSNAQQVVASWWNTLRTAGVTLEQGVNPESNRNFILNSQFRFWQESLNKVITSTGSVENQYGADQVLISNSFASGGEVRVERIPGVNTRFAFQMKVETFISTVGDYDAYFPIANREMNQLLNRTITFKCLVKAVGNINRIGTILRSNTSEAFAGQSDIGVESNTVINSSTFTEVTITQAIVVEPTQAGMLWLRLRPNQASSGDENDAGNGIIVEQPQLVIGTVVPASYFPAYKDEGIELAALQYFFEKSYDIDITPGTSSNAGRQIKVRGNGTANVSGEYKKTKRATPTVTIYSPDSASIDTYQDAVAGNLAGTISSSGMNGFSLLTISGAGTTVLFQFTSDARIF